MNLSTKREFLRSNSPCVRIDSTPLRIVCHIIRELFIFMLFVLFFSTSDFSCEKCNFQAKKTCMVSMRIGRSNRRRTVSNRCLISPSSEFTPNMKCTLSNPAKLKTFYLKKWWWRRRTRRETRKMGKMRFAEDNVNSLNNIASRKFGQNHVQRHCIQHSARNIKFNAINFYFTRKKEILFTFLFISFAACFFFFSNSLSLLLSVEWGKQTTKNFITKRPLKAWTEK